MASFRKTHSAEEVQRREKEFEVLHAAEALLPNYTLPSEVLKLSDADLAEELGGALQADLEAEVGSRVAATSY